MSADPVTVMAPRLFVFFQAEDGIRDTSVTEVQTCALPIWFHRASTRPRLMPCIRAWLQPCRWRQSIQGFSPRCLPPCQVRETIGELLGPLDNSPLHRVRRYVFPMLDEALPTLHARLGEATLPDLSQMAPFLLQAV